MLDEALGTGRMLALAMPRDEEEAEVEKIAGAGIVRACIRNPDGTSNLIMQGVSRIRFTAWEQMEPFRIARVETMESFGGDEGELSVQVTQLHALCTRFKEQGIQLPEQFESYLNRITHIGVITDLVASTLLADSSLRQILLEELDLSKRLQKLLAGLRSQLS
jgi:ATP-dependent Lon protease